MGMIEEPVPNGAPRSRRRSSIVDFPIMSFCSRSCSSGRAPARARMSMHAVRSVIATAVSSDRMNPRIRQSPDPCHTRNVAALLREGVGRTCVHFLDRREPEIPVVHIAVHEYNQHLEILRARTCLAHTQLQSII